jgi:hypothetical protein
MHGQSGPEISTGNATGLHHQPFRPTDTAVPRDLATVCNPKRRSPPPGVALFTSRMWIDRKNLFVNARIFLLALVVGFVIAGCGFAVDRLVHHASRLYASDLYTFVIACVLSYLLMMYEKRRRKMLERRMMIAAEVNHHIRNALTAVVFSASVQNDPGLQSVLKDATARINWVLTTVLPDGSKDLMWPVQSPEWHASSWQGEGKTQSSIDRRVP